MEYLDINNLKSKTEILYEVYSCINNSESFEQKIRMFANVIEKSLYVTNVCVLNKTQFLSKSTPQIEESNCYHSSGDTDRCRFCVKDENVLALLEHSNNPYVSHKTNFFFPIVSKKVVIGYWAFDVGFENVKLTDKMLEMLEEITSIISIIITLENAVASTENTIDILTSVLENVNISIYVSDIQTNELLFANKTIEKVVNANGFNSIKDAKCYELLQLGQQEPCDFCPIYKLREKESKGDYTPYRWEYKNPINNKWYYLEDSFIRWFDGRKVHLEYGIEFTQHKIYTEELEQSASKDALTGILNRESGYKYLGYELEKINETNGKFAFCFLDVDGLKKVNDNLGHSWGDMLLITISSIIKCTIRHSDIFFRWAGDEFCLILSNCDYEKSIRVIRKINNALVDVNSKKKYPFTLGISIGVEEVKSGSKLSIREIIDNADKKMYEVKTQKYLKRAEDYDKIKIYEQDYNI